MSQLFCTVGIDIGTTSVKTLALDYSGKEISRGSCQLVMIHGEEGAAEQDPVSVYEAVLSALADLVPKVKKMGYMIRQVGFSSAMHSLLLVSKEGKPLTHAMTWMDIRSKHQAGDLWLSKEGKSIYTRTGTPVHPMSPLPKLIWLRKEHPSLFGQAAKFVSLKEWIWYQWFHVWEIDASMASATGLYNLVEGNWDELALSCARVGPEQLSKVVATTYFRKDIQNEQMLSLGFDSHTAFNIGASDGVLANLGLGAIGGDAMAITIGTSCALRMGSLKPTTDIGTRSFCYVLDADKFIVGGPSNSGGIVVERLHRQILGNSDRDLGQMLEEAGIVDTEEIICLPYLAGERAPIWNADAKAAWIGLQLHHTYAHVLRAAIEGILLNAYWIASNLFEKIGKPLKLVASGGLLQVQWVRQLLAQIFNIPVEYREEGDASTMGAIMLAEMAVGIKAWNEISQTNGHIDMAMPDSEQHKRYQKKFKSFRHYARALELEKNE
ncbi:MAG TPA: gluconokinase [Bacillota bacterium]|nr:gluconokinase [Bacillota bacterium]